MVYLLRCLVLSFITSVSCQLFYETIVPRRQWSRQWTEHTILPAFTAVFLLISVTWIPPFILRPVRIILMTALIAQIYFQMNIVKNLILSVTFCGIYWSISTAVWSVLSLYMDFTMEASRHFLENLTEVILLGLIMAFHSRCKSRFHRLLEIHHKITLIIPFLYLITMIALSMMTANPTVTDSYARLTVVSGFAVLSILLFYITMRILEKEETLQKLRLRTEHTQKQMAVYQTMQKHYEQQRSFVHDYKNQLNCIQGLLNCGRISEASDYITRITGTLREQFGDINTNHTIVNILLNQKYQTACEKAVTMTFAINDLSKLVMPEEDLVTLLANLLDNAIEACEKLDPENTALSRNIRFKMVLEEGQLILSVRNPVITPVPIKNNMIVTSKKDSIHHGIGLSNVDAIIKKYNGTSVLACDNRCFSFSALLYNPLWE
ncbi:MAG: GHKL domain-containing protein [Lachnospiraceae bacterium]|nr:GHKL domain-containing protein [Lachnospiraceae bacterium]